MEVESRELENFAAAAERSGLHAPKSSVNQQLGSNEEEREAIESESLQESLNDSNKMSSTTFTNPANHKNVVSARGASSNASRSPDNMGPWRTWMENSTKQISAVIAETLQPVLNRMDQMPEWYRIQ